MEKKLSKKQAQEKIQEFFQTSNFKPEELKKIKRLAMKYRIRLGTLRKKFCKKCLNSLKGKTRITKTHKTVICKNCQAKNKFKLAQI